MLRSPCLLMTVAWLVFVSNHGAAAQQFYDGFDGRDESSAWEAIRGDWELTEDAYVQRTPGRAEYRYTLVDVPFAPKLVAVEATPIEANSYGFASFGFVLKYIDSSNWAVIRFGSYGGVSLLRMEKGKKTFPKLGVMAAEIGRTYRLALASRGDRIAVFLDGQLAYVLNAPWPGKRGRLGLFTECACRFDKFEAHAGKDAVEAYLAQAARREQAAAARAVPAIEDGVFVDQFGNADACPWRTVRGAWKSSNGRYEMSSRPFGRYMAQAPLLMADGAIEGAAVPLAPSAQKIPRPGFGVLAKWLDSANWAAVRYGEYGALSGLVTQDGKLRVISMGRFDAEEGRCYRFRVEVRGKRIKAYCDGAELGQFDAPFAGTPARVGLYTEAPAAFDDLRIEGAMPLPGRKPKSFAGKPQLELAFAEFRPAGDPHATSVPTGGGVRLFVRNRGTAPAYLHRLLVGGEDADRLRKTVSLYRQRPAALLAGQMGLVLVHLAALPRDIGLRLFRDPDAKPELPITIEPYRGDPLHVRVSISGEPPKLQLNYLGFGPTLQRIYAYVQQNGDNDAKPLRLTQVLVDGRDLTERASFGQRQVGGDVVPIVIDLREPLREGQPVTVCVGTREGQWAGHGVRAFPGEFHCQVTLLGKQTRADAVEDIWRHCATCIGFCGASEERLAEAKALGLEAFHYTLGLKGLRRFDRPEYPRIAGFWLDEMDRHPARYTFDRIQECEQAYADAGRFIPLQMINLCSSRSARAVELFEIGDATCGAYGYYGGAIGEGFGRLAALPRREYRVARLSFMPYFRDAEMPVVIDPKTKTVLGRCPKYRRCIEPKEERWLTYGCLIQGAKGILHWNYGSGINPAPNWFSKTATVIRAGMGGALHHRPHGYEIPADQAAELKRVWDEIGRINVELRAIGPLVAVSDVSRLARVASVTPQRAPNGEPAAEAAALVSGVDSIVLIVLNHNLKHNWKADADRGIESYELVDAIAELRLPAWIEGRQAFRVRHTGADTLSPRREGRRLLFEFPQLEVNEVVVVTDRGGLMESMRATISTLSARLAPALK